MSIAINFCRLKYLILVLTWLVDPLLIPSGLSRIPDSLRERSSAVQPPSTLSAYAWLLVGSTSLGLLPMLASMGCHSLLSFGELLLQTSSQESLKGLVSFASSELPVGTSDVRGFAGNVENRQMIRLPFASGSLKNRGGMRLEAGGWRTIQRDGTGSCAILGWVQIRLMVLVVRIATSYGGGTGAIYFGL